MIKLIETSNKMIVLVYLVTFITAFNKYAQPKKVVFKNKKNARNHVKIIQKDILPPMEYDKALGYYNDVEKQFNKQKGIEKVEGLLTDSVI